MSNIWAWTEPANGNTATPPDGFARGMLPGSEDASFREIMAAIKRDWNLTHPTLTLGGTGVAVTLTPSTPLDAYVSGQIFFAKSSLAIAPDTHRFPTLNISGLGPKPIYFEELDGFGAGVLQVDAQIVPAGMPIAFYYDETLDSSGAFVAFCIPPRGPVETITCPVTSESGTVSAGTGKFTFRLPYAFSIMKAFASLKTAQVSGSTLTIDINLNGSTLMSPSKLTFTNGNKEADLEKDLGALTDDGEITIDVDQVGTGAVGLKVYLTGRQQ